MEVLCKVIERLQARLEGFRRLGFKEAQTRSTVIDPLLEALGWDVRDPGEVQLEHSTVDNKSVDYALKINGKPVLLVEAKPLDDALNDVKSITQVVGYAANDGIASCVLTNGVKWQVYRSMERCPAPDKLMFEVDLDPRGSGSISVAQLAQQMWRLSREETAKGTLDDLGEKMFTDTKIRKALDALMRDPPGPLLNMIRRATGDQGLRPREIADSLKRIWGGEGSVGPAGAGPVASASAETPRTRSVAARRAWQTRRQSRTYDENHHTEGKPQEAVELYRALDRACLAMAPGAVEKRFTAKYIGYQHGKHLFCCVHIQRSGLRVWLKLKYNRLASPPGFARDVSHVGHWGMGDVELGITTLTQMPDALPLVRQSFSGA